MERRHAIAALQEHLTPNDRFFVRNHFDMPGLDPEAYLLHAEDIGRRVTGFTLAKLDRLPQRHVTAVLECIGNGRRRMVPRPRPAVGRWRGGLRDLGGPRTTRRAHVRGAVAVGGGSALPRGRPRRVGMIWLGFQ